MTGTVPVGHRIHCKVQRGRAGLEISSMHLFLCLVLCGYPDHAWRHVELAGPSAGRGFPGQTLQ